MTTATTQTSSGAPVRSEALLGKRRKPTKGDLIALVSIAAHEAGSAITCFQNDRQPDRAGALCDRLLRVQQHMLEAVGHFPPPRKSPWDLPNQWG